MGEHLKIEEYQRLLDTFQTVKAVVYSYDLISKKSYIGSGVERIFGCAKQQFDKKYWKKAIHPEDKERVLKWEKLALTDKEPSSIQYRIICPNNEVRWIEYHTSPVLNMFGEVEEIQGLIMDINDGKEQEQKFEYMAFHDTLTGLPNRNMFNEYSQKALSRCLRKNQSMAVLFVDLDLFKDVNDNLGHDIGDLVLRQVAERFNISVRDGDYVFRQGGDEFIILLEDTDQEKTEPVVQRILSSLSAPFYIQEEEIQITAGIGISIFPLHGEDMNTLIRNADEAMYIAKEHGANMYYFYETDMQLKQIRKMKLEQALRKSIANKELAVYYQPVIDFYTGDIIAMEALLRWFHPALGMIMPLEFIPIAEESAQIESIGEWVLGEACTQNKAWQDLGYKPIRIIVNISNHQLKSPNFLNSVKSVLLKTGLSPEYIELDITEGFMQNMESALPIVLDLSSIGLKVSVDNFGTGVFSFNVLHRLPIEYLKIGRNLMHDLGNKNTSVLIQAIIQMGRSLNLKLMAEGIENEEHLEFLKANNCYLVQGDYYSPPIPAQEAGELLRSFGAWKAKFGGLASNAESRMRKIEAENQRLKQLLAERMI